MEEQELLGKLEANQEIYNLRAEEAQTVGETKYLIENLMMGKANKDDIHSTKVSILAKHLNVDPSSIAVSKKLETLRQVNQTNKTKTEYSKVIDQFFIKYCREIEFNENASSKFKAANESNEAELLRDIAVSDRKVKIYSSELIKFVREYHYLVDDLLMQELKYIKAANVFSILIRKNPTQIKIWIWLVQELNQILVSTLIPIQVTTMIGSRMVKHFILGILVLSSRILIIKLL